MSSTQIIKSSYCKHLKFWTNIFHTLIQQRQKFIYDIWGDTVNIASCMEALGEPGKIQVTTATYERLKSQFVFEQRGAIAVKGKGNMITYWLTGFQDSTTEAETSK